MGPHYVGSCLSPAAAPPPPLPCPLRLHIPTDPLREERISSLSLLMRKPRLGEAHGHGLEAVVSLWWVWLWGHSYNGTCAEVDPAWGLECGRRRCETGLRVRNVSFRLRSLRSSLTGYPHPPRFLSHSRERARCCSPSRNKENREKTPFLSFQGTGDPASFSDGGRNSELWISSVRAPLSCC